MVEKEKKPQEKTKKEKKDNAPSAEASLTPQEIERDQARKKQAWTMERCMKAARRFSTEEEWKSGAPASYKSAEAKGWINECTGHMRTHRTGTRRSA